MENCERVKNQFSEFLTANPDNELKFFVKFVATFFVSYFFFSFIHL